MYLRALLRGMKVAMRRPLTVGSSTSASRIARFCTASPRLKDDKVRVTFVLASGQRVDASGALGDSLLDVVVNNSLPLDGYGACEGTLTCSTCHVVLKPEDFARIENAPLDEEQDMLELAYGLTDTSRLGCQITLTRELDGLEVHVPETINDARS